MGHASGQSGVGVWPCAVVGEGHVGSALGRDDGAVVDAEIAQVHFVNGNVLEILEVGLGQAVPARWFEVAVVEVDKLGAGVGRVGRIGRKGDGIGVGDDVVNDCAFAGRKHIKAEEEVMAVPICRACHTPHPAGGVFGEGMGGGDGRGCIGKLVEDDFLGGGRPNA